MLVGLLSVRFLVELALFAGAAIGAAHFVSSGLGKILLAVGASVLVIAAWSTFLSPKRPTNLPLALRLLLEVGLFVVVALGLWFAGLPWLGVSLLALDILVLAGLRLLGEEPGRHFDPFNDESAQV